MNFFFARTKFSRHDRYRYLATATVLFGMFIAAMESLIGATILPSIIASLGRFDLYPLMVSCFLLALVVTMPLYGKLADHFGFLKVYLFAIALFLIGSLWCGLAGSMEELIAARCIQGMGTAGLITLCLLYIGLTYPLHSRHKMQALVSTMWASASLVGPAFGAFIVAYFSWRSAFLINVPLSILMILGAIFFLRYLPKPEKRAPLDFVGAFLFAFSVLTFLSSLIEISKFHYDLYTTSLFVLSCVGLVTLLFRALRNKNAFISIDLIRGRPHVATSLGLGFLGGGFLFSTSSFIPIFIQGVQGESIKAVGQVVSATALGTCAGSFITAFFLTRLGFRKTSLIGSLALILGLIGLLLIDRTSSVFFIASAIFLTGIGIGASTNAAIVANQTFANPRNLGAATGLFSFSRTAGGMLAIALLGAFQISAFRYDTGFQVLSLSHDDTLLILNNPELIFEVWKRPFVPPNALDALSDSLSYSIHLTFMILAPFAFLHCLLSLMLPNQKPHEVSKVPSIDVVGK